MLNGSSKGKKFVKMIEDIFAKKCTTHSVSNRFSDPKFIDHVCISYRHDFGLLDKQEKEKVRVECKEWMRAIKNNVQVYNPCGLEAQKYQTWKHLN